MRRGFRKGFILLAVMGISLSLAMYGTAGLSVSFISGTDNPAVIKEGVRYMAVISLFYLFNYIGAAYVGFFNGIGKVGISAVSVVIHITIRVILARCLIERWDLPRWPPPRAAAGPRSSCARQSYISPYGKLCLKTEVDIRSRQLIR